MMNRPNIAMKKIISILFLSSLETIVFVLIHDFFFREIFIIPMHGLLSWGISFEIAFIEFMIFSLVLNTFLITHSRIKPIWPIIAATVLYSVTWVNELFDTTMLTVKLLMSAGLGFLSYLLFSRLLRSITRNILQDSREN